MEQMSDNSDYYVEQYRVEHPQTQRDIVRAKWILSELTGKTLLDVGCSSGILMEMAADSGWEVTGVDPNTKDLQSASRFGKTYNNINEVRGEFDWVVASHVLEHVSDPFEFIRGLKKGKNIFVVVPQFHPSRQHTLVFMQDGLENLLRAAGLEIVKHGDHVAQFWAVCKGEK